MRFIIFIIIFAMFLSPLRAFAEGNNTVIDLTIEPGKVLFDLSNIKPGDTVSRELVISNSGTENFKYITSNKFISGSQLLFKNLDLKIKDNSKTLYDGKLSEFKKLDPRPLNSKEIEKLIFYIKVPYELGNEYQGLNTEFQFKFYVEGTLGGTIPADGPKLPETGTPMFNFMVAGAVLLILGLALQIYKRKKLKV